MILEKKNTFEKVLHFYQMQIRCGEGDRHKAIRMTDSKHAVTYERLEETPGVTLGMNTPASWILAKYSLFNSVLTLSLSLSLPTLCFNDSLG